jgi:hypothetical protein
MKTSAPPTMTWNAAPRTRVHITVADQEIAASSTTTTDGQHRRGPEIGIR